MGWDNRLEAGNGFVARIMETSFVERKRHMDWMYHCQTLQNEHEEGVMEGFFRMILGNLQRPNRRVVTPNGGDCKGIPPKMAETFGLRIYNKLPR